jgi:EpsI family protein
MRDRTRYAPAMILAIGALLATAVHDQSAPQLALPLGTLPSTIDGYAGSDVAISEEEREVAGVSSYLMREFRRDSVTGFSVYVGYYTYQTQGRTIHSPKNCLPGAGWQALGSGTTLIEAGGASHLVNRYILANGENRALVYYWYQGRGRIAASEFTVKWDLLRDIALHGRSEEALVRIVVPIARVADGGEGATGSELLAADRVATASATALIPAVTRILPPWTAS